MALLPGDDLRNLVQENAYDPWGLNLPDLERGAVLPDWWQFSMKERDFRAYDEFEFRHYDAAIGRFMSIDPLFQQFRGISPFNYADNNPSTFIDLYGLQGIDPRDVLPELVVIGQRAAPVLRNVVAGYGAGAAGALMQSYLLNRVSADISSLNRNLQQPGRITIASQGEDLNINRSNQGNQSMVSTITVPVPAIPFPAFRLGPTPITLPTILAISIPTTYVLVSDFLRSPSAVDDIAQFLERVGVPSDILRGQDIRNYTPAPKTLPGFPNAIKVSPKAGRARWKDQNGDILEWDYQHGEVEVYNKNGKIHRGAADPETGLLKPNSSKPGRTTQN